VPLDCRIVEIAGNDPRLTPLVEEARAQGFQFMDKLVREWADGTNRFARDGECYLALVAGDQVLATGGLNVDPYSTGPDTGRIRHVYVADAARRGGVGRLLLAQLVERARDTFQLLRLRTRTERGAAFYETIGFDRSGAEHATHVLAL
jgi:GNAT superfamily N-acetyltransferase